jgi:hypothetical protein
MRVQVLSSFFVLHFVITVIALTDSRTWNDILQQEGNQAAAEGKLGNQAAAEGSPMEGFQGRLSAQPPNPPLSLPPNTGPALEQGRTRPSVQLIQVNSHWSPHKS